MFYFYRKILKCCSPSRSSALLAGACWLAYFQWTIVQEKQVYSNLYQYQKTLSELSKQALGRDYRKSQDASYFFSKNDRKKPRVFSKKIQEETQKYARAILKNKNNRASQAGAVDLADFYRQFQQEDQAIELLENFRDAKASSSILVGMLFLQLTGYYIDRKQCDKALDLLARIRHAKKHAILHAEASLQQALCKEASQNKQDVEQAYKQVMQAYPESSAAKRARTYLKLFMLKYRMEK